MQELADTKPETQVLLRLLDSMLRIRRFEECIVSVYGEQDMKTPVHLYIGQEAVASGVIDHLRADDYVTTTHRSHGHCLAKGVPPLDLLAEFYGREAGCCHGRGGSMHPASPRHRVMGTSAIVGGGLPIAVGQGLACALDGGDSLSAVFFGDGASEEGTFHEGLNFAALKSLPVLFVCENNFYATASHLSARQPDAEIHGRAKGYGIPSVAVDGNDVAAVWAAAGRAVRHIRAGNGPYFLECRTYRWKGHVGPECDYEKGCRPKEELFAWMERCPIKLLRSRLGAQGPDEQAFQARVAELDRLMHDTVAQAKQGAFPSANDVTAYVYSE